MKANNIASATLILLTLLHTLHLSQEAVRKTGQTKRKYSHAYEEYLRKYKLHKKWYYSSYNPSKVKGRCVYSPNWKVNGTNGVYKAVNEGYMVILYLIKADCRLCFNELRSLHVWAEYYKKIDKKIRIIAINHRWKSHPTLQKYFPLIKIYQEPSDENIFKKLKGKPGDVFVYDRCGRHLYYYGYPYSSLVKPFVRLAVKNTEYHYKTMCGPCLKKELNTTTKTRTNMEALTHQNTTTTTLIDAMSPNQVFDHLIATRKLEKTAQALKPYTTAQRGSTSEDLRLQDSSN